MKKCGEYLVYLLLSKLCLVHVIMVAVLSLHDWSLLVLTPVTSFPGRYWIFFENPSPLPYLSQTGYRAIYGIVGIENRDDAGMENRF